MKRKPALGPEPQEKLVAFDLSDSRERMRLLGRFESRRKSSNGRRAYFIDFALKNLPVVIQRQIDALPDRWQENQEAWHDAERINHLIEKHYRLPNAVYASLDDERRVWIRLQS